MVWASVRATIVTMASKGKPSPRSAVSPLSDEQVKRLAARHTLVDSHSITRPAPARPISRKSNAQNPKATKRLLGGVSIVFRASCKTKAWGLEQVPETGPFITAASHVTMFDVFVPMMSLFHMAAAPRYMAKAEMAKWPLIGQVVPVGRHAAGAASFGQGQADRRDLD